MVLRFMIYISELGIAATTLGHLYILKKKDPFYPGNENSVCFKLACIVDL